MNALNDAIADGTLSNTQTLAELHKRRDVLANDDDLLPEIRERGLTLFETAIAIDAPKSISDGRPVVAILFQVLVAVGRLYRENELQQSTAEVALAEDDTQCPKSWDELLEPAHGAVPVYEEQPIEQNPHVRRIEAAVAARRKRKIATHGPQKKVGKTAHQESADVKQNKAKDAVRFRKFDQPSFTSPSIKPSIKGAGVDAKHNYLSDATTKPKTPPGIQPCLIVKLKVAALSVQLDQRNRETTTRPRHKYDMSSTKRRKPRTTYKSAEYVGSDMDEDANDNDEGDNIEMRDTPFSDEPRKSATKSSYKAEKPKGSQHHTISPTDSWETASDASDNSPTPSTSSATPLKSLYHPATYPPFPAMPVKDVSPFHKGAQIALENIMEDHIEYSEETLLELIEELEENRPTVGDWERVTILKGGTYVYEALRGVVDGAESKDLDVSIEEVVEKMTEWVDVQVERLKKK